MSSTQRSGETGASAGGGSDDNQMSMSVTLEHPAAAATVGSDRAASPVAHLASAGSPTLAATAISDANNPLISPQLASSSSSHDHDYASAGEGLSENAHHGTSGFSGSLPAGPGASAGHGYHGRNGVGSASSHGHGLGLTGGRTGSLRASTAGKMSRRDSGPQGGAGSANDQHMSTSSLNGASSSRHANGAGASAAAAGPSAAAIALGLNVDDGRFRPMHEGSTVDAREFVRLTLQSLRDLGLEAAARALEQESGVTLEHPSINAFRSAVMSGDWRNAERLLLDGLMYSASRRSQPAAAATAAPAGTTDASTNGHAPANGNGHAAASVVQIESVLRDPETKNWDYIKFLIQQQRYLELLEARQTAKALSLLRRRLAPLNHGSERLQQLSSLVICSSNEELRRKAEWEGTGEVSRRRLLREIEDAISPVVMLPSRRLPALLQQAQTLQKHQDPFFNSPNDVHTSLYTDHRSDRSNFPSRSARVLEGHTDEVWDIAFTKDGTRLASGGKDCFVIIWKAGETYEIERKLGPHLDAVHCVAWSPDSTQLVATSDPDVTLWDVAKGTSKRLGHHLYRVGTACWLPDGSGFVTGGEDAKVVFWDREGNVKEIWRTDPFRLIALDISPDGKHLIAVAFRHAAPPQHAQGAAPSSSGTYTSLHGSSSSNNVEMSDVRSSLRSPEPTGSRRAGSSSHDPEQSLVADLGGGSRTMGDERYKIIFYDMQRKAEAGAIFMTDEMSSVKISDDSRYVLINQRPNEARLWDIERQSMVSRYFGHQMTKHIIRSCFGGIDKSFVISGSEDATIYMYHRSTGRLLEKLEGHGPGCINAVAWHPTKAAVLASCSDDKTIRIWGPGASQVGSAGYTRISTQPTPSARPKAQDEAQNGSEDSTGPTPFPWAMSPLPYAPSSPFFPVVQSSSDEEDDEAMEFE